MRFPLMLMLLVAGAFTVRAAEPPPQGAAMLKTDLLGVFAHPDDETGMAATLARYGRGAGRNIAHVYVTRGEGGGNMVGLQSGPSLGILREAELRNCLAILGVRSCHFLDQTDFFYTESHAATLRKWDRPEALKRLVRIVRALRPEVIVTMNPAPNPGQHGHHQAAGVLATEAFSAAADPTRYPEQLKDEGLTIWQARKLFYAGAAAGAEFTATVTTTEPLIDGRAPADIAGEALSQHRSQAFGGFVNSPWLRRPQAFTLVKSVVKPSAGATDLFEGLPAREPVHLVEFGVEPASQPMAFLPRPAIRNFLDWTRQFGVRRVFASFPADVPVVAGENTVILLEAATGVLPEIRRSLRYQVDAGWPVQASEAGHARVTVPPGATADAEIVAIANYRGSEVRTSARLHPLPRARVPAVRRAPDLGPGDHGWEAASLLIIGTNQAWQGRANSAADCSARVRLAHDSRQLFVEVDVADDIVVSNIAPDDIKGHWRSDSVEICIDPAAGAEDTTGCFKIGIFPFDSTGRVRAARDADARQGPVEETAPGLQLASERTAAGYRVRAAIPYSLISGRKTVPRRLGFNVLIYDGDKADAAPGENINKSRLAWAPRPGVQGRPDDWGRIDLE